MEYFTYGYKNVKTDFTFYNYELFMSSNKVFKYYLIDLALISYDPKIPKAEKDSANSTLQKQKFLFCLPYPIVLSIVLFYKRKKFFSTNIYLREQILFIKLFIFVSSIRLFQKGLLKYDAEDLLKKISSEKLHSI